MSVEPVLKGGMSPPGPSEQGARRAAMLGAGLMILQQVGAKATRDALFLSTYPAHYLPTMMVAAATLSILGALLMTRTLTALGPNRVIPLAYGANAALFAVEWLLSSNSHAVASIVVYLHIAAAGPIVISGFWSVVNESH